MTRLRFGTHAVGIAVRRGFRCTSRYASCGTAHCRTLLLMCRAARVPLGATLAASYVLSSVPQVREIYRAMAEDFFGHLPQLAFALPILCTTAIALSVVSRELLRIPSRMAASGLLRRLLPVVCAILPTAGLALGMFFAARETHIGLPPQETLEKLPESATLVHDLSVARTILYVEAAVCALIAGTLLLLGIGFRSYRFHRMLAGPSIGIGHFALLGIISLVFFSILPVSGSQLVGPIGIFLLAMIGVVSVAALLTRIGDRAQLPLLTFVILAALTLSFFDLTDNHVVRLTPSSAPPLKRAVDEFEKWYAQRADRKWYEDRGEPYPVFVVAASGGGLYAAQHVTTVLSRLQDRCPNFSQHVFAISGVSGGSLGGALFSSMAKNRAQNGDHTDCDLSPGHGTRGQFETMADRFLESDFLSPVLAAALFPDGLQRFLPAFSSRFDRAKVFESSLSKAWNNNPSELGGDVWSKPFLEHWDPERAAPALILNATNVEHGYRVAITPFKIIDWAELGNIVPLSNLAEFHVLSEIRTGDSTTAKVRDISLSAAVSLSARFPWIMPAGRLEFQGGSSRIVDGGYVENSGSETAFDLIYALSRFYDRDGQLRGNIPPVRFLVIAVTNLQILQHPGGLGLGEILSPIRTMLSTRETRAVAALGDLGRFTELCGSYSECGKRVDTTSFMLDLFDYDLPLGWLLAPSTRSIVRLHSGLATRAGTYLGGNNIDDADRFQRLGAYVSDSDSAACTVMSMLDAKKRSCN